MKIGILVWDLNINGGTQRQALELALHLQDFAVEVMVYTYLYDPAGCYPDLCSKLDIRHVRLQRLGEYNGRMKGLLQSFKKYSKFYFEIEQKILFQILDNDLDLLNAHDYRVYPTAGLWKEKTEKPVVWMMNDMPMYRWNREKLLKTTLFHLKPRFRNYIRSFDKIVVLDNINKLQVERNFGCTAEVVRSGIDIRKFSFAEHPGGDEFRLLSTGIFLPHRRIEDSIHALDLLIRKGYKIRLDHIGSTDRGMSYAKKIYSLVEKLGLQDRVTFNGRVNEHQLLELYSQADLFVFPNAPQTWGLSVFEAMACGLPVVLTTGCGASEVLSDGMNAIIVKPRSPRLLAEAIELLYTDHTLRKHLSREGRKFVENNVSWRLYAESMLRVFLDVIEKGR